MKGSSMFAFRALAAVQAAVAYAQRVALQPLLAIHSRLRGLSADVPVTTGGELLSPRKRVGKRGKYKGRLHAKPRRKQKRSKTWRAQRKWRYGCAKKSPRRIKGHAKAR